MDFIVVIPARYQSSRLPGKPLADIHGKSMVQWVYERAVGSGATQVIVATDDSRIATVVKGFGGEVCVTSPDHQSGTERLAEVVEQYAIPADTIIVNVQGDEPLIPSENITQVAQNLHEATLCRMSTLSVPITEPAECFNPNAVKVVTDKRGYALYFSRSVLPFARDQINGTWQSNSANYASETDISSLYPYQRHIGIYAYRAAFIRDYVAWEVSPLEKIESLEQLRVLWHGEKIHVAPALVAPGAGVDTPEDLELVRQLVKQGND